MKKFTFLILCFLISGVTVFGQKKKSLDKVAAVVGNSIILNSDIETQYNNYLLQGNQPNPSMKCQVLQSLLTQKLLAQQAAIDSVIVKDDDVDQEVERRMRYYVQRAGSQEKLEQFLGKSVIQYKDEIRPDIRELLTAQRMQQKITEKVNVTPQDVRNYFNAIPKDSLPKINKVVEIAQIQVDPKLNKDEKELSRAKAEALRTRIKNGEDFATLATLYSQDPGSAPSGGDLGFADRGTFVKEFAAMAFKMKPGEISPVFETDFGFHFLQVIERRGEQVHVRHILIVPATTPASIERAKAKADSIYTNIKTFKMDFSTAASLYSDDKETKYNGGMMTTAENVENKSTFIPTDKLDPQIALIVDTMKVGSIAQPALITDANGKKSYRILYLRSKTDAHIANMAQDYPKLKDATMDSKTNKTVSEWFEKKRKQTYINIDPEYTTCDQLKTWVTNSNTSAAAN